MATDTNPHIESRRALRSFFGKFPQVVKLNERLQKIKDYQCVNEEPECLSIIGQTGTGKSTLLSTFERRFPRVEHEEFTEVPVLYMKVPSNCTVKRLSGLMLYKLGSPLWNRGNEEERTVQLLTLLEGCYVRLVILDEVNHLADRGAAKTHYAVGDWIKQLSGESGKPVVLAGTPSASLLFATNEQLADRYEVVTLEPLSMAPDRIRELKSVLMTFQRLMSGLEVVDFTDEKLLKPIVCATAGRLRDIRKLLVRAVEIVESDKRLDITRSTLEQAFLEAIYPKARDKPTRNPFHDRFNGLPLTGAGEPFAPRGYQK